MPEYTPIPSGDQGEHVYLMQARLAELGYLTTEYDGYYGEVTVASVKVFQTVHGLEPTGEADAVTLATLFWENATPSGGEVPEASPEATPEAGAAEGEEPAGDEPSEPETPEEPAESGADEPA